jgi:hypothetical protein
MPSRGTIFCVGFVVSFLVWLNYVNCNCMKKNVNNYNILLCKFNENKYKVCPQLFWCILDVILCLQLELVSAILKITHKNSITYKMILKEQNNI